MYKEIELNRKPAVLDTPKGKTKPHMLIIPADRIGYSEKCRLGGPKEAPKIAWYRRMIQAADIDFGRKGQAPGK